ncbi:hypothetical protein ITJ64_04885 [Herbiconiux sp. VKM Ac-1786]|uniref:hypothetical protein n=1 Tax=Herbiconiux sp. VKM Ac-1786 TaxID=2783824 RepID=UPI00188CE45D|nr:hypothetical protein [Herbiconiux sp. VKM Ac-1786]MBF4571844.1 hypothetical protein [Herbiconiux sp. VKM Ac-1786]
MALPDPVAETPLTNSDRHALSYEFWPATIRSRPLHDHVEAAVAGGFTSLAISPSTYYDALDAGMTSDDIRDYASSRGVPVEPAFNGLALLVAITVTRHLRGKPL